jgi:hypothetical protein
LTVIMCRAGILAEEARVRVQTQAREHGVSEVEVMLDQGVVTEEALADFMASKLLIPRVSHEVLGRVDATTLAHVPAELAWMYDVLPISVDDVGNLTLAMADPTGLPAVEAVAAHTGAYLIRAVAPLGPLRAALQRCYGPPPPLYRGPPTPRTMPAVDELPPPGAPLSAEAFRHALPRLSVADDRDAIMERLLDFLGAGFSHVILFIHLRDQIRGRDARGDDLLLEAVTRVRIPTTGPSRFRTAIETGAPHVGPWGTAEGIDAAFARALGGIGGDALVLPIRLRDKVPLVVFACGAKVAFDVATMRNLSETISQALERLIYRRKNTGPHAVVEAGEV